MEHTGLEKIFYPRNPVKRRITTSTPLGYLIGYLKYYIWVPHRVPQILYGYLTQKESLITYAYSVIGA